MRVENNLCSRVLSQVNGIVVGKELITVRLLAAMLAGGHVLLTDIPGVGKTTLAMAFSRSCALEQKRMQFTPDVMPADVTGFSLWNKTSGQMEYQPGAVMCNLFLADEINRTSSRTQSALLEAMEERQVTVDGITRKLPSPFLVIATQNPAGAAGTQKLPESQLDRFMIGMSMGYPSAEQEIRILKNRNAGNLLEEAQPVIGREDLLRMQQEVSEVYVHDDICAYMVELTSATRKNPDVAQGVSPRGTLALMEMSKAAAYLNGYDFVLPEHVQFVFRDVCGHRILLQPQARRNGISAEDCLRQVLSLVKAPAVK